MESAKRIRVCSPVRAPASGPAPDPASGHVVLDILARWHADTRLLPITTEESLWAHQSAYVTACELLPLLEGRAKAQLRRWTDRVEDCLDDSTFRIAEARALATPEPDDYDDGADDYDDAMEESIREYEREIRDDIVYRDEAGFGSQ